MRRVYTIGGAWVAILMLAGDCLAGDPNQAARNAQAAQAARAQQAMGTRSSQPYASPQQYSAAQPNQAARNAAAAQAARAQAAMGQSRQSAAAQAAAAVQAAANSSPYPYPYGYGSPGYGYYRYRYPYGPNGSTQYILGYDPYSGQSYLIPNPGGYSPYSPYGYRNPYYNNPYLGFGYPGAVFVNPGQLYGVGPIQQLMGVGGWFQQPQNVAPFAAGGNIIAGGGNVIPGGGNVVGGGNVNPGFANANPPAPANGNPPAANAVANNPPAPKPAVGNKAQELAWKFIAFGDAQFADLKFNEALDRYRRARREAPHLGDAWFREGFALAAMGKFDQAAKAMAAGWMKSSTGPTRISA